MAHKSVEIFPGRTFGIVYDNDETPSKLILPLHNHDDVYEIVLLLNGDCEFYVEGNKYSLRPRDIVFTRPFELHKMAFVSEKNYERIILYIHSDYFKLYHCEKYLDIFQNRPLGTGNIIPYDTADRAIRDCMRRLLEYGDNGEYDLAGHIVYEFLHLINSYKNTTNNFKVKNDSVRNIIMYINDNLSENLNLDVLSSEFFISKHYMCKIFKANTGYTINQYINYKRILLVQELHRSGETLIQASLNAGFNSYANFYKTYVKQTGTSPRGMD